MCTYKKPRWRERWIFGATANASKNCNGAALLEMSYSELFFFLSFKLFLLDSCTWQSESVELGDPWNFPWALRWAKSGLSFVSL